MTSPTSVSALLAAPAGLSTKSACARVHRSVNRSRSAGVRSRTSALSRRAATSERRCSAALRSPVSPTARSYSGPKRSWSSARSFLRRWSYRYAAAAATSSTTTMTMMAGVMEFLQADREQGGARDPVPAAYPTRGTRNSDDEVAALLRQLDLPGRQLRGDRVRRRRRVTALLGPALAHRRPTLEGVLGVLRDELRRRSLARAGQGV